MISATMHVHHDQPNCMEVIAMRARAGEVREHADRRVAVKGMTPINNTAATSVSGWPLWRLYVDVGVARCYSTIANRPRCTVPPDCTR